MIDRIKLKFGSSLGQPALEFDLTPITVFVGPNNSGKSRALIDLAQLCTAEHTQNAVIMADVTFRKFSQHDADAELEKISRPAPQHLGDIDSIDIGYGINTRRQSKSNISSMMTNPNEPGWRGQFVSNYMQHKILMLNGESRIRLVSDQAGGDLQNPATTTIQKLFRNDELRKQLSRMVFDAFGSYLVIDPTNLGTLRYRLSEYPPSSTAVERGLDSVSLAFHAAATHVTNASDGAKAFIGILSEILTGDPKVLFIDEPEAFLHPGLAFRLGREVSASLSNSNKRMFVATHSPQFLMGCIHSGIPLNIVRLTYRGGVSTARLLPSEKIIELMRKPILRSANVLSALFYESVIVSEADTDRAFYQEINDRLLRQNRGISNCIFLNAQGKHTVPTIIAPLRQLGIPAAAVYDIDFVKDGGKNASKFMDAAGIPSVSQPGLSLTRANILKELSGKSITFKKDGGINLLSDDIKEAAIIYFDHLDTYGSFVVRGGEVESWLSHLEIKGHASDWLIPVFEKMGEDTGAPEYVRPAVDDVWAFIDGIGEWLSNPNRKGMPI